MFTAANRKSSKSSNLSSAATSSAQALRRASQEEVAPSAEKVSKFSTPLQAKLIIGAKDDSLEPEADNVASRVLSKPDGKWRQESDKEKEREKIKRAPEEETQKAPEEEAQKAPEEEAQKAPEEEAQKAPEEEAQKAPEEEAQKAPEEEAQKAPEEEAQKAPEEEEAQKAPEEEEETSPAEDEGKEEFDSETVSASKEEGEEEVQRSPEEMQKTEEETQSSEDEQVQGKEDEEAQTASEKSPSQQKAESASPDFEAEVEAAKSGGRPLPPKARSFMEDRFGADFTKVVIHIDNKADRLCKQIGAKAFAVGNHIFFSSGRFQPDTRSGRFLLAHELTHVLQQGGGVRKSTALPSVTSQTKPVASHVARKPTITSTSSKVQGGWLSEKINKYARQVPGFTLITVLVGYNPILGEAVPRTAMNLVGGLLGMIPGGTALFDRLKESGALQEAFSWLSGEVRKLNLSWKGIKTLLAQAWDEMSLIRGFSYNLNVIKRVFGPTVRRIINFGKAIGTKVMELIFKGALKLVGAPVSKVMSLINKGTSVLGKIFGDPIQFVKNLARGVKMGLQRFLKNIKKHLIGGLIAWLTGALGAAGITLPEKFDLKGIFSLVMQILGLTYERIRPKLVKRLGEKTVNRIEKTIKFVKLLVTKGPVALWEMVKEKISELKAAVMDGIRSWVITKVVTEGVTWILGLLNPAGALIKIIKMFYSVIKFFIERWSQIVEFATSVFNSIGAIANGQLSAAAKAVETTLARALPVMIGFFASLLGLGGISKAIKKIIMKIRAPIDKAVNKGLDWVVKKAKSFVKKAKKTAQKVAQKVSGWFNQKEVVTLKSGESHKLFFKMKGGKPTLMMASEEDTMKAHNKKIKAAVDKRAKELPESSKELIALYQEHLETISKIRTEIGILEKDKTKNADKIASLRDEKRVLKKLLNIIQEDESGNLTDLEKTQIKYGGTKGGVGTRMTACPLTIKGDPGSGPSVDNDTWKALNLRRNKSGSKTYYVRGHLLNDNIHGPGGKEKNITPLTESANRQHSTGIEDAVKGKVSEGLTLYYNVKAIYPNESKNLSKLDDSNNIPKQIKDAGKESDLKRVVEAEKYVPKSIECEAYTVNQEDVKPPYKPPKKPPKFSSFNKKLDPIVNVIGSLAEYNLGGGGSERTLKHLNLYDPMPQKLDKRTGEAREVGRKAYKDGLEKGIGKAYANLLFNERKNIKPYVNKDGEEKSAEDYVRSLKINNIKALVKDWSAAGKISFGPGDGVTRWNPPYEGK